MKRAALGLVGIASQAAIMAMAAAPVRMLPPTSIDWTSFGSNSPPPSYLLLQGSYASREDASEACAALQENLVDIGTALKDDNLVRQLAYLVYERVLPLQRGQHSGKKPKRDNGRVEQFFWSASDSQLIHLDASEDGTGAKVDSRPPPTPSTKCRPVARAFPALCTNSAPWKTVNSTDTSPRWRVSVQAGQGDDAVTYTGYRDLLGFRFASVPYAKPPARFAHSTPLISAIDVRDTLGSSFAALRTTRDQQCPQTSDTDKSYTEDGCLVLNIATGFLPNSTDTYTGQDLRPIIFFLHGGGFSSGSGLDGTFDGTFFSSRSDIVVISPNYRLGTLGWLAVSSNTSAALTGNFGLGDVIAALQWVRAHAYTFGGDPNRISIVGQSAGAQIVQLLLQSPAAAGLFESAVVMSGRPWDKANQRVNRTVAEQPTSNGGANGLAVLTSLGCSPEQARRRLSILLDKPPLQKQVDDDDNDAVLDCLRALPTSKFLSSSPIFTKPVIDGTLITAPTLDLSAPSQANGHVNRVPLMLGTMRDELGGLGYVPPPGTALEDALTKAKIPDPRRTAVVQNKDGAFPLPTEGRDPVQNITVTVETDSLSIMRCGHDSSLALAASNAVFPVIYAYEFFSRAWQIPNYDPNAACQPRDATELDQGHYFLCHSGDLMALFATPGFMYDLAPRDAKDLDWIRSVQDAFAAFVRSGGRSVVMDRGYAAVRGYGASQAAVARWRPLQRQAGEVALLGAGGVEAERTLGEGSVGKRCAALGLDIDYVRRERTT